MNVLTRNHLSNKLAKPERTQLVVGISAFLVLQDGNARSKTVLGMQCVKMDISRSEEHQYVQYVALDISVHIWIKRCKLDARTGHIVPVGPRCVKSVLQGLNVHTLIEIQSIHVLGVVTLLGDSRAVPCVLPDTAASPRQVQVCQSALVGGIL